MLSFAVFLSGAGFSIVLPTLWDRIHNDGGDTVFYGATVTSYCVGEALASPYFGLLWQSQRIRVRTALLLTLAMEMAGNTLYFFLDDRYALLVVRFVCGVGAGNVAVCRGYVSAHVTSPQLRARAMAFVTAGQAFGFVAGPLIAAAFSQLDVISLSMSLSLSISLSLSPSIYLSLYLSLSISLSLSLSIYLSLSLSIYLSLSLSLSLSIYLSLSLYLSIYLYLYLSLYLSLSLSISLSLSLSLSL